MIVYSATKGAIAGLTMGLSNLLAPKGIRVNCVAPGPVWTPIQPIAKSPEEMERLGQKTPLGRAGQPGELAGAYVLLAAREGSYMSGALNRSPVACQCCNGSAGRESEAPTRR